MSGKIRPGFLTPSQAAALNAAIATTSGLEVSGLGAGVARVGGTNGQYLHLSPPPPPPTSPPPSTPGVGDCSPTYLLGVPKLVRDGSGNLVGISGVEVYSDGRARCVVTGFSELCGAGDVPPPDSCVTVSGTVALQPEDVPVATDLYLVGYGPFQSDPDGTYAADLSLYAASVGFTCCVPADDAPRDVYYSLDGGATWTLATDLGLLCDGFMLDLPATCDGSEIEVLWGLWTTGYAPEGVVLPP